MISNSDRVETTYTIQEIANAGVTGYPYALTITALKQNGLKECSVNEAKKVTKEFADKGVK